MVLFIKFDIVVWVALSKNPMSYLLIDYYCFWNIALVRYSYGCYIKATC